MLDTIALMLNQTQFSISDYNKFSPSAVGLFQPPYYKLGRRGNFSCYQNPTKNESYKPRLTLTKRMKQGGFAITLRVEFSAPKLLHGNNFDELTDVSFDDIITTLIHKLVEMGVETDYEHLADANVSAIHYSKNIPLTDYSSCSMIINELHKVNLNKRLDLAGTDYRNNGQAIRYHSNSFEIAIYDKIKDLQQAKTSEKRAMEHDNYIQMDLLAGYDLPRHLDVLRMEVRLGNRQKIKQVLGKIEIEPNLRFAMLFSKDTAQKILRYYWEIIWQDLKIPLMTSEDTVDIYGQIASSGKYKPAKILQLTGAIALIQESGIRGLRNLMTENSTDRTWQRLKREIDRLELRNHQKFAAVANIGKHIEKFEPLRIIDYAI